MPAPALIFASNSDDPVAWGAALRALMPELEVRVWPETGRVEDVVAALVWRHPDGALNAFPNLKLVVNLGAGVDPIFADPHLPRNIPIVRLVDPELTRGMTEYVVLHVLALHRRLPELAEAQRAARWHYIHPADTRRTRVGLMGLGNLGGHAADMLARIGFQVSGWSRTPKQVAGVDCFHGRDQLPAFLKDCDIVVCLLPLTAATENLIDAGVFAHMRDGTAFVNAGRGRVVVDDALLAALDSGRVRHAVLDVFRDEPLPADHRYWRHPRVTMTPHNATAGYPETAAPQIVDNIRRVLAGQAPVNVVDRAAGY
ncbi:MAG: glyoxylate/hydroxypyruvate reductase A [Proteobacteria bacterium]|nr:glyoxylate/hydroxypyruvate reductase A [Pseudomonadota bacterium]